MATGHATIWRRGAISVWVLGPIALARPTIASVAPLTSAPAVVQAHVVFALAALWLGGALLLWSKGKSLHRKAGLLWASLLSVAAITSLFITTVRPGHWSTVHALSAATLVALPAAVWAARRHHVKTHRAIIYLLFVVALVSEFASAFLPGRMFHAMFAL